MSRYAIFAVVALLAVAAIAVGFGSLKLDEQGLTLFGQLLGTLLILSAVLERGLDVLLSIPRAQESDRLRAAVKASQEDVEAARAQDPRVPQDLLDALEQVKDERAGFRAATMRIAMAAALLSGVVISAIGFRILNTLVDENSFGSLEPLQRSTFDFIDIVLTGAVLAGGSDGVHKLIEVYRNFTEKGSS